MFFIRTEEKSLRGVVPGRGQGTSQIRDKEELLNEVKQVLMVQDGCLVNVVTLMPEKMRQSVSRQGEGTWEIPWPVRGAEDDRHYKLITSKPANVGLVLKIEAG